MKLGFRHAFAAALLLSSATVVGNVSAATNGTVVGSAGVPYLFADYSNNIWQHYYGSVQNISAVSRLWNVPMTLASTGTWSVVANFGAGGFPNGGSSTAQAFAVYSDGTFYGSSGTPVSVTLQAASGSVTTIGSISVPTGGAGFVQFNLAPGSAYCSGCYTTNVNVIQWS